MKHLEKVNDNYVIFDDSELTFICEYRNLECYRGGPGDLGAYFYTYGIIMKTVNGNYVRYKSNLGKDKIPDDYVISHNPSDYPYYVLCSKNVPISILSDELSVDEISNLFDLPSY